MEDNKSELVNRVISLYMRDLVLYVKEGNEWADYNNHDLANYFIFDGGYIYKKDNPIASITKMSNKQYQIGINYSSISDISALSGIKERGADLVEDEVNYRVISAAMQQIIADKLNQYFIPGEEGHELITDENRIGFTFTSYPPTKYERRVNLY